MKAPVTLGEKMAKAIKNKGLQPGEVVVKMHELLARHKEIPDTNDCYLVRVWSDDISEEEGQNPESDCLAPVPFLASHLDALTSAREGPDVGEEEEAIEDGSWWSWGWDGTEENNRVRFQGNSATIRHPIYLHFRWGYGAPSGKSGAIMLPHETASKYHEYCRHCGKEVGSVPRDCATLRLRALVKSIEANTSTETNKHIGAMYEWHNKSRPKER